MPGFESLSWGMRSGPIKSEYPKAVETFDGEVQLGVFSIPGTSGSRFHGTVVNAGFDRNGLGWLSLDVDAKYARSRHLAFLRQSFSKRFGPKVRRREQSSVVQLSWDYEGATYKVHFESHYKLTITARHQSFDAPTSVGSSEVSLVNEVPAPKKALPKKVKDAVAVYDTDLLKKSGEFKNNYVWFAIHFENKTDREIVGIQTFVVIQNAFGKTLLKKSFENEVIVPPDSRVRSKTGWIFEDNPFVSGELYDRLWQAAEQGTAKVSVVVRKVIFRDGSVIK